MISQDPYDHSKSLILPLQPRYSANNHSDASGRAQPSEEIALSHVQALEDIGYRTVGTNEALQGEEYVLEQARALQKKCEGGVLICEVWEQIGSGGHSYVSLFGLIIHKS